MFVSVVACFCAIVSSLVHLFCVIFLLSSVSLLSEERKATTSIPLHNSSHITTITCRMLRLNVHTNQILAHTFSHGTLDSVVS